MHSRVIKLVFVIDFAFVFSFTVIDVPVAQDVVERNVLLTASFDCKRSIEGPIEKRNMYDILCYCE